MNAQNAIPSWLDAGAVTLSCLCVLHCLALPVLAVSLPVFGAWADAEWMHKLFVLVAVGLSGWVISTNVAKPSGLIFASMAIPGLAILIASAYAEALHDYEDMLTVVGAGVLALAHGLRLRRRHAQFGSGKTRHRP